MATEKTQVSGAGLDANTLARAIVQAVRETTKTEPPKKGPTDRLKAAADGVKGGTSVYDALVAAGYSAKFARGHAKSFAPFLAAIGLVTPTQGERAYVGVVEAPIISKPVTVTEEAEA